MNQQQQVSAADFTWFRVASRSPRGLSPPNRLIHLLGGDLPKRSASRNEPGAARCLAGGAAADRRCALGDALNIVAPQRKGGEILTINSAGNQPQSHLTR